MLRIRIVPAGVILMAAALFAGNLAAAPTAGDQNGKPLALLAGLKPPPEHKSAHAKAHTSAAASANKQSAKHTKVAHNKHHTVVTAKTEAPVEPAKSEQQADMAPVAVASAPVDTAPPANTPAANPSTDNRPDALGMNAIVVGGQTVQIAAPDDVNALDLAADDHAAKVDAAADTPTPSPPTTLADAAPVSNVYAAPVSKDKDNTGSSAIGSMSWIAQIMAALGGAVTAGMVAWFLIGGGPARMYG